MLSGILGQNEAFLTGLNRIESRISKTNQEVTSGIQVNVASDDPSAVSSILSYQSQIDHLNQITSNFNMAATDAASADSALQSATTLLDNISSLGAQGLTLNADPATRQILGKQVQDLQTQLVSIANTSVRGNYIFAGDNPSVAPYGNDPTSANGVANLNNASSTSVLTDANGSTRLASLTASQIFDVRDPAKSNAVLTNAALGATPALDATANPGIAQSFTFNIGGQSIPLTVSVPGVPGGYTTQSSLLAAVQTALDKATSTGTPALPAGSLTAGVDVNNHLQFNSSNLSFTVFDNGADDTAHNSPAGITGAGNPSDDNIFAAVGSLSVALLSNNTAAIQTAISNLKAGMNHLQSSATFYGNVETWINESKNNAASQIASLTTALSGIKDTDLPTALTQLTLNNTALSAAIEAHASLSNKTLFSYLG